METEEFLVTNLVIPKDIATQTLEDLERVLKFLDALIHQEGGLPEPALIAKAAEVAVGMLLPTVMVFRVVMSDPDAFRPATDEELQVIKTDGPIGRA
jgi:hypothetical protein